MKLIIFLCLLLGMFLLIQGIYEEKLNNIKKQVKVEYRYVPRSYQSNMILDNIDENKNNSDDDY